MLAIGRFFSTRFHLYGRQLRLVDVPQPPSGGECDASQQRSSAAAAVQQRVFASTELQSTCDSATYRRELVRRQVVTVAHQSPGLQSAELESHGPYQWSYGPTVDETQRHFVEFACSSLKGRHAEYGGPGTSQRMRKFAVLRDAQSPPLPVTVLVEGLRSCTGAAPRVIDYGPDFLSCFQNSDTETQALMTNLATQGVTTLLSVGADLYCAQRGASKAAYQPEWAVVPAAFEDYYEPSSGNGPPDQSAHTFGLATTNKWLPIADEPTQQAISAGDPSSPRSDDGLNDERRVYRALLLLASGIQAAGPRLTPTTLERGLLTTTFPNPGAAGPPSYQAAVGLEEGDRTMVGDMGLWWWKEPYESPTNPDERARGGYCYVQRGKRWALGQWPSALRLFEGPCR